MATTSLNSMTGRAIVTVIFDYSTGSQRALRTDSLVFEVYNADNISHYVIACTEDSPENYQWTVPAGTPASPVGVEYIAISYNYVSSGDPIAVTDLTAVWRLRFSWDGTRFGIAQVSNGEVAAVIDNTSGTDPLTVTVKDQLSDSVLSGAKVSLLLNTGSYTLTTDDFGQVVFSGLSGGTYLLLAYLPGYQQVTVPVSVTLPASSTATIYLTTAAAIFSVTFTVTDTGDSPLDGAAVSLIDGETVVSHITGSDGKASFVLPGKQYQLTCVLDGYYFDDQLIQLDSNESFTLVMQTGSEILVDAAVAINMAPNAGNPTFVSFTDSIEVTLIRPGAALVWYTLDGSVPTPRSPSKQYTSTFVVSSSLMLRATVFGGSPATVSVTFVKTSS